MLFTKNTKLWNERKKVFLYIWLLQRIKYTKRCRKPCSLDAIAFLDLYVCINNPYWQVMFYLLLTVILSEIHENPRKKIELQKKVHRKIFVRDITFLAARPPYAIFCRFFRLLPLFRLLRFYVEKKFKFKFEKFKIRKKSLNFSFELCTLNSNCCKIHILRYNSKSPWCFTFWNSYSESPGCSFGLKRFYSCNRTKIFF